MEWYYAVGLAWFAVNVCFFMGAWWHSQGAGTVDNIDYRTDRHWRTV